MGKKGTLHVHYPTYKLCIHRQDSQDGQNESYLQGYRNLDATKVSTFRNFLPKNFLSEWKRDWNPKEIVCWQALPVNFSNFWFWSRNGILNKNSHKIAPLLWMISKVTQRVKLSLNLLINGFRWRFPIMGSKISPRISWANLNLKIYVPFYMAHIIWPIVDKQKPGKRHWKQLYRRKIFHGHMHFRIKIFLRYP